jgi:hypothetical protein
MQILSPKKPPGGGGVDRPKLLVEIENRGLWDYAGLKALAKRLIFWLGIAHGWKRKWG